MSGGDSEIDTSVRQSGSADISKSNVVKNILKQLGAILVAAGAECFGIGLFGLIACWALGVPIYYWACAGGLLAFGLVGAYVGERLDA